jgi:hypothetical protein
MSVRRSPLDETSRHLKLRKWRRRMGIEPTHRGLNPEHWI